jgi:two-component system sensor histidine kinase TorS
MGGNLQLTSEINQGSCFYFELPLDLASPESIAAQQAILPSILVENHADKITSTAPLNILIVEDDDVNLGVAIGLTEKLGHNIVSATNGKDATAILTKNLARSLSNQTVSPKTIHLALLDINLPDINGTELSKQLKTLALKNKQTLKTIAVSAHVFKDDIDKFIQAGFDDFIAKPVQMKRLAATIARVMQTHSNLAQENNLADNKTRLAADVFNNDILNQDLPYLGTEKVIHLIHLFEQQALQYISQLSTANTSEQQQLLHKFKGAAHSVGLVALHQLCQQFEVPSHEKQLPLSDSQLHTLTTLIKQSLPYLKSYQQTLTG